MDSSTTGAGHRRSHFSPGWGTTHLRFRCQKRTKYTIYKELDWTCWPCRFWMIALDCTSPDLTPCNFSLGFCKTASVSVNLPTYHRRSSCPHHRGHCASGWSSATACMAGNWIQTGCASCGTGSSYWALLIYVQLWTKCFSFCFIFYSGSILGVSVDANIMFLSVSSL